MEENPIGNGKKLERNPDGTVKSGVLNPNGRPAGARSFTTKVKEALEKIADGKDYSYEEAFIKAILKGAIVDGKEATQKLIWNYLDGMPLQKQELFGNLNIGKILDDVDSKGQGTPTE